MNFFKTVATATALTVGMATSAFANCECKVGNRTIVDVNLNVPSGAKKLCTAQAQAAAKQMSIPKGTKIQCELNGGARKFSTRAPG